MAVIGQDRELLLFYPVSRIRKTGTFFLLLMYFMAAAGSGELLKMPLLASHYFEHAAEGYRGDFITYLLGHYLDEAGDDADAGKDNELPFRSVAPVNNGNIVSVTPPPVPGCPPPPVLYSRSSYGVQVCSGYTFLYLQMIWQPPRV